MQKLGFLALIGGALTGCGMGPQAQMQGLQMQAQMDRNAAIHDCQSRFPTRIKGQAAAGVRCMNEAHQRHPQPGFEDLAKLAGLKSVDAAERFDAGKITAAQLDIELATIQSEYQTSAGNRYAQQGQVTAMQQQAAAAQQRNAIQQMATGAAIMSGPPVSNTTCSTLGNNVNCRHY
jgi:hypothetical protein